MYLSQLSISFLAQAILALAFSLYLISRQNKTRPTVWLTLSMVGTAGFFASRFIYKSLSPYSAWQPSALFLQYLFVPLLIVPLVLFAYEFPQTLARQDKERKVAAVLAVAGGLVAILATVQLAFFQIQSIHGLYINLYILLGNLWVMLVLLRRTPALAAATDLRSWWAKLWRPQNWEAQGARAFGLAAGLIVSAALPSILSEAGLLSRALANSIQTVLTLSAVFAFTIVYLNYAPEPTTIAAKLVGFTLFTVLTMLGVLSFVVAPFYERAYLNETLPIPPQAIQFTPNAQAGYAIAAIDQPVTLELGQDLALGNNKSAEVTLPFAFPFYGQARTDLYVSDNGIVTFDSPFYHRATQFGQQPAVVPLLLDLDPAAGGGVFVNQTAVSSTITWHNIPGKNGTAPNTIQLTLYPDGRIIFSYLALAPDPVYGTDLLHGPSLTGLHPGRTSQQPEIVRFTEDLPYSSPAQTAVWEPYQTDFRSYLHQRMLPLAYLVLAASLLVIVGIPLFFQASLLRPLRSLVAGIEQVNQGDLTVTVPVRFNDEIGFVTESFNGMVNSLKQSDQLKDEFLANTSHELRTPLNGIVGLTESLLAGDAGSLSVIQMQHLAMIASSGRRLTSLVNDILDFSQLKHSKLDLQSRPVDLHMLAAMVLALSEPLIQDKPLRLVNEIPADLPLAYADEDRVQQILHNLVSNAIKFSDKGQVTVSGCRLSADWLEIQVTDTGIGIPATQLEYIFTPFVQGDGSSARQYGGTGLGLSITRQLVRLHGGQIQVTSQPGEGSRFSFTLPLSPVGGQKKELTTAVSRSATISSVRPVSVSEPVGGPIGIGATDIPSKREQESTEPQFCILVVDDEPINLQVLKNYLSPQGYRVVTAQDGPEALRLINNGLNPDLVILDVMMPRMTGYEACAQLRLAFPPQNMPIIMLTARNQIYDLVQGFNAGANDYLAKPFSKDELLTRIRSHLQLSQTNRAYGRFVPSEILKFLKRESIIDVQLGDQIEQEMTVMFADVRNFTGLSANMSPQENFYFINTLFGRMGPLVRQHHGFIDKYMGDSIMALFPRSSDDAVQAAITMQNALKQFNAERVRAEKTPIRMGIGIHRGALMLGTIGEAQRMEGTVISDAVNTCARIESLTKRYGVSVLMSNAALAHLPEPAAYHYRFVARVHVKGKDGTIAVYELFDSDEQKPLKAAVKETFEAAADAYYRREFDTAVAHLEQVLAQLPDDPVSHYYLEKARRCQREGVPDEWDGITRLMN